MKRLISRLGALALMLCASGAAHAHTDDCDESSDGASDELVLAWNVIAIDTVGAQPHDVLVGWFPDADPPDTDPGDWQATPSCTAAGGAFMHWQDVEPFGIESPSQPDQLDPQRPRRRPALRPPRSDRG